MTNLMLSNNVKKLSNPRYSYTDNGAITYASSGSYCLNLFYIAPAMQNRLGGRASKNAWYSGALTNLENDTIIEFQKLVKDAWQENSELTLKILLWMRDCRGGAGSRQAFRVAVATLLDDMNDDCVNLIANALPNIGRYDDLVYLLSHLHYCNEKDGYAFCVIVNVLIEALSGNYGEYQQHLAAKWTPRKGFVNKVIGRSLGFTNPKDFRKFLVQHTNVPESLMCKKQWDEIEYSKVPSLCMARNRKVFGKHDAERFNSFIQSCLKGESKINANAAFPHDILRTMVSGNMGHDEQSAIVAQWNALNEMNDNVGVLPVVDVSASMTTECSGSLSALHVAISMGLYFATKKSKNNPFYDRFVTFSGEPEVVKLQGNNIVEKYYSMGAANWEMNTNIQKVFDKMLEFAKFSDLAPQYMPKMLLILSDMEFDDCVSGSTNYEEAKKKWRQAGYELPIIVFWNLMGRSGNVPVRKKDKNVALLSGYSPAVIKSLLRGSFEDLTSEKIMLDTVNNARYDLSLYQTDYYLRKEAVGKKTEK